jgi:hypothetical protein
MRYLSYFESPYLTWIPREMKVIPINFEVQMSWVQNWASAVADLEISKRGAAPETGGPPPEIAK